MMIPATRYTTTTINTIITNHHPPCILCFPLGGLTGLVWVGGAAVVVGGATEEVGGGWADEVGGWADEVGGWADEVGGWADEVGGGAEELGGVAEELGGWAEELGGVAEELGGGTTTEEVTGDKEVEGELRDEVFVIRATGQALEEYTIYT